MNLARGIFGKGTIWGKNEKGVIMFKGVKPRDYESYNYYNEVVGNDGRIVIYSSLSRPNWNNNDGWNYISTNGIEKLGIKLNGKVRFGMV